MVVVMVLKFILGCAVVVIGLGVLAFVANSFAHAQACKVHAAKLRAEAEARVVLPLAVPELPSMIEDVEEPPQWAAEPAPEDPATVELFGMLGLMHECAEGIGALFTTGDGVTMPVLIPTHILRLPDEGQRVTVRGAMQGQRLHIASWAPSL